MAKATENMMGRTDLTLLEQLLTIKMGGICVAVPAILMAVFKFIH